MKDLFLVNKIFFLKNQIFLFVLLFLAVLFFGVNDAIAIERPELGEFVGLAADTKLNWRWNRISAPVGAARALKNEVDSNLPPVQKLEEVTKLVNNRIKYRSDKMDQWSSLNESLARGYGDCEDIAIGKYQLLKLLGFSEDDMFLVVSRDLVVRADHAFLLVRINGQKYILDNMTDNLIPDVSIGRVFQPVFAYSGNSSWIFGKKRQPK